MANAVKKRVKILTGRIWRLIVVLRKSLIFVFRSDGSDSDADG